MQKIILILAISFILVSCEGTSSKQEPAENPQEEGSERMQLGSTTYAVIWNWATSDTDLVSGQSPTIASELNELWKQGVVENAYYDPDAPVDKLDDFPNIAFFMNASSHEEVSTILNRLTIFKEGIANYKLHPVGQLWLARKTDIINEKGLTQSFAAVWKTGESTLQAEQADQLLKDQSDQVMALWNSGKIENVYFDIEGTYSDHQKADFVFFVNANTREEAETVCEALPFYQAGLATYDLHQAGVFWMGRYGK